MAESGFCQTSLLKLSPQNRPHVLLDEAREAPATFATFALMIGKTDDEQIAILAIVLHDNFLLLRRGVTRLGG